VLLPAIQRGRCRSARMPRRQSWVSAGQVHHQDPSNLHWSGHMHNMLFPEEHAEMVTAVLGGAPTSVGSSKHTELAYLHIRTTAGTLRPHSL
jgi:hypothetical protein